MSACIEWTGSKNNSGYGTVSRGGQSGLMAHRDAYEAAHGYIPDGMVVMHSCDNPPCVNIAHLRLGTRSENQRDSVMKGRMFRKLTEDQVRSIKYHETGTNKSVGQRYGVSDVSISKIRNGKVWRHV